jgi:phage gp45-like
MAAVNTAVTQITGNATITGAMGTGVSASRDSSEDTFSKTLKCHASNGFSLSPILDSIISRSG